MEANHFLHRISKKTISELPLAYFQGEINEVGNTEQMSRATMILQKEKFIGLDTETKPTFSPYTHHNIAILQMACDNSCFLFHLQQIGLCQPIVDILTNEHICKVGLALRDDIKGLKKYTPFVPKNCIDVQHIALNYGILDMSLVALYAICFGKRISKNQRLSNWENEKLTVSQKTYAATDAWATLQIYKKLINTEQLSPSEIQKIKETDKSNHQI